MIRLMARLVALLLAAAPAGAGVEIDLEAKRLDRERAPESASLQMAGERLTTRIPESGDGRMYRMIYRGGREVLWLLDEQKRTFFQVDPTTTAQVATLKKSVQQGLQNLPPERREALGQLLGDFMPEEPPPQPPVEIRARGEKDVLLGYSCEWHDVLQESEKVMETCVAEWEQGDLTRENLAAVPSLAGFLEKTLEPLLAQFPGLRGLSPLALLARVPGLPMLTRTFEDGVAVTETAVTRLEQKDIDPARFKIPEGYQQSLLPPTR